jgi:hypothetical protein
MRMTAGVPYSRVPVIGKSLRLVDWPSLSELSPDRFLLCGGRKRVPRAFSVPIESERGSSLLF